MLILEMKPRAVLLLEACGAVPVYRPVCWKHIPFQHAFPCWWMERNACESWKCNLAQFYFEKLRFQYLGDVVLAGNTFRASMLFIPLLVERNTCESWKLKCILTVLV